MGYPASDIDRRGRVPGSEEDPQRQKKRKKLPFVRRQLWRLQHVLSVMRALRDRPPGIGTQIMRLPAKSWSVIRLSI